MLRGRADASSTIAESWNLGTIWEQLLPNAVLNEKVWRREKLDEAAR